MIDVLRSFEFTGFGKKWLQPQKKRFSESVLGALSLFLWASPSLSSSEGQWYDETLYPEYRQGFQMNRVIFREKTEHQDLVIFENDRFGRVLALDGAIQLTEADEPAYHEMLVHVPLLTHGHASSVLVVGGGDGGSIREVLKHSSVKKVVLVEIDPTVVELSKQYFPNVSKGAFEDPRLELVIQDACEYVKECSESFDVILCDSTDPIGPGKVLFTSEFYGDCKKLLREGGIFANHHGVPFLQTDGLPLAKKNMTPHYENVRFYLTAVTTYVGGFMAMGFASDVDYQVSEAELKEKFLLLGSPMKYYTPSLHKGAFALPHYMLKQLEGQ